MKEVDTNNTKENVDNLFKSLGIDKLTEIRAKT
jgi:hypothetical protein